MFNNSTNIKETNNHLSPKIIENIKTKHHITLEIHILTWDRLKNVAVLNRSMGSLHIDLTLLFLFLGLFFKNKNSYRFLFCKKWNENQHIHQIGSFHQWEILKINRLCIKLVQIDLFLLNSKKSCLFDRFCVTCWQD